MPTRTPMLRSGSTSPVLTSRSARMVSGTAAKPSKCESLQQPPGHGPGPAGQILPTPASEAKPEASLLCPGPKQRRRKTRFVTDFSSPRRIIMPLSRPTARHSSSSAIHGGPPAQMSFGGTTMTRSGPLAPRLDSRIMFVTAKRRGSTWSPSSRRFPAGPTMESPRKS